jgi:hypothetical protein
LISKPFSEKSPAMVRIGISSMIEGIKSEVISAFLS